jgi:hypothetical protein
MLFRGIQDINQLVFFVVLALFQLGSLGALFFLSPKGSPPPPFESHPLHPGDPKPSLATMPFGGGGGEVPVVV